MVDEGMRLVMLQLSAFVEPKAVANRGVTGAAGSTHHRYGAKSTLGPVRPNST